MLHPSHSRVLDLCHHTVGDRQCIGQMLMIDFGKLFEYGPIDQHQLRAIVTDEVEKNEDFIRNTWFTSFISIFTAEKINAKQPESFYKSVSVLVSNQVNLYFVF